MDELTLNIEREWFADLVDGTKKIEYRPISPFWKRRIGPLVPPVKVRLINGMTHPIPEARLIVTRIEERGGEYLLHVGRVRAVKNWDRRKRKPKRGPGG
jgi:hypothetical protein